MDTRHTYHWGYRHWGCPRTQSGDIAFVLRCHYPISRDCIHNIIQNMREQNIVPDKGFMHDPEIDLLSTWNTALAFELCPCVEMYYPNARSVPDWLTWRIIK